MEDKNAVIIGYASALTSAAGAIANSAYSLSESEAQNTAMIKTLNVLVESLRSQTVLIQQALDSY